MISRTTGREIDSSGSFFENIIDRPRLAFDFGADSGALPESWPPSSDLLTVDLVILREGSAEGGLFVRDDKDVSYEKEKTGITRELPRSVKERRARERESRADVHGISYETIGPANYQTPGRVERRGRAASNEREGEDAPQRQRGS